MDPRNHSGGSQPPPPQNPFSWLGSAANAARNAFPGGAATGTNPLNPSAGGANSQQTSPPNGGGNVLATQFSVPTIPSTFPILQDLSSAELRNLMQDEGSYMAFLSSLDPVRQLNEVRDELRRSNLELSKRNLSKESEISQLQNQCRIIRGTELASARERLEECQRREQELMQHYSPAALAHRLQAVAQKVDDESEELHSKFLAGEVEVGEFLQKYRKLRLTYHRRTQLRIAAGLSRIGS